MVAFDGVVDRPGVVEPLSLFGVANNEKDRFGKGVGDAGSLPALPAPTLFLGLRLWAGNGNAGDVPALKTSIETARFVGDGILDDDGPAGRPETEANSPDAFARLGEADGGAGTFDVLEEKRSCG